MEWNLIVSVKNKNRIFEVMARKLNESLILELLIKGKIKINILALEKLVYEK